MAKMWGIVQDAYWVKPVAARTEGGCVRMSSKSKHYERANVIAARSLYVLSAFYALHWVGACLVAPGRDPMPTKVTLACLLASVMISLMV